MTITLKQISCKVGTGPFQIVLQVDYQCPTLVMAECALVYADSGKVEKVMEWLAGSFTSIAFINYEQLNMNDRWELACRDLASDGNKRSFVLQ